MEDGDQALEQLPWRGESVALMAVVVTLRRLFVLRPMAWPVTEKVKP